MTSTFCHNFNLGPEKELNEFCAFCITKGYHLQDAASTPTALLENPKLVEFWNQIIGRVEVPEVEEEKEVKNICRSYGYVHEGDEWEFHTVSETEDVVREDEPNTEEKLNIEAKTEELVRNPELGSEEMPGDFEVLDQQD